METGSDIAREWRVNRLLAEFYDQKKRKTCAGCAWEHGCDCTLPFGGVRKIVPSMTASCDNYEEAK